MSKHTPGPWKVAKPQKSHANGKLMYGIVGPEIVADYEDWGFTEANARLIAAAPDLLETCKSLLDAIQSAIKAGDWKVDGACDPDIEIHRAMKVIAKASGSAT